MEHTSVLEESKKDAELVVKEPWRRPEVVRIAVDQTRMIDYVPSSDVDVF